MAISIYAAIYFAIANILFLLYWSYITSDDNILSFIPNYFDKKYADKKISHFIWKLGTCVLCQSFWITLLFYIILSSFHAIEFFGFMSISLGGFYLILTLHNMLIDHIYDKYND